MNKMKKKFKKMKVSSDPKRGKYSRDIHEIAQVADFENVACEVSKEEVMTSSEPIFFMNNSICNIPSPITIPTKVFMDGIETAYDHISEPIKVGCYFSDSPVKYLLHELLCSITNLIISSMNDCINHILNSDIFVEVPCAAFNQHMHLLGYHNVYDRVEDKIRITQCNILEFSISDSSPENLAGALQTYFKAPMVAKATEVFTDIANEFANDVSFYYTSLNSESAILRRMSELNPLMNMDVADTRNILFAAISAMFYNYSFSFSGMADVEIGRVALSAIHCFDQYNKMMGSIVEKPEMI